MTRPAERVEVRKPGATGSRPGASAAATQTDRRRDILSAAIAVIARDGLSATTMEKVAQAACISPGTITFHFAKKDQLLLAALDAVAEEFDAARRVAIEEAGDDPARALLGLIDVTFDPEVNTPDKVAVWYAFWGEANAREAYLARVGGGDQAYLADLVGLFRRIVGEGGYHNIDPEAAAIGFAGLLEWQWQGILVDGPRFDRRRAIRLARAYLTGIFQRHF